MKSNKFTGNKILLILCIAYILFRLVILFTSPYLFDYEESRMGLIAKEIIEGPKLPFWEYQNLFGPWQGGLIINGILIIPLFYIFGEFGVVLKLLWLLTSLGTLIVVYLFLNKFFNKKLAILTSLFFILSPQFYTIRSLTDASVYNGAVFFTVLIMYLFYNTFFNNKPRFSGFALFGLVSGFALFFELSSLVMIFTCILFWFIFDKKFFLKKGFFIFIIFFLIGFSPGLYYNFTHDFSGLGILSPNTFFQNIKDPFFQNTQNENFILAASSKFFRLLTQNLPDSFNIIDWNFENGDYFEYTFYLKFLNYGYYLIFAVSFIYLIYLNRKNILKSVLGLIPLNKFGIKSQKMGKEVFILAYPIIFAFIFSISHYDAGPFGWNMGYKYILPVYPFIFIIISLFITNMFNNKNKIWKFGGILVFTLILLIGITSNFSLISFNDWNFGNDSLYKPYDYKDFADTLGISCSIENFSCKNRCNKLNAEHIPHCYRSIGKYTANKLKFKYNKSIKECEELGDKKKYCYIGVGLGTRYILNTDLSIQKCDDLDIKNRVYCYQGLGLGITEYFISRSVHAIPSIGVEECNIVNKKYQQYCYKGLSEGVGLAYRWYPVFGIRECKKLPEQYQSYCLNSVYLS